MRTPLTGRAPAQYARRLAILPIALVVAVLSWPVTTIEPGPGLDPSWQIGLHLAANAGLDYGTEVVFTYGPLGFLATPVLAFGWSGGAAFVVTLLLRVALAALVIVVLRRNWPLWLAAVVAFVLSAFAATVPEAALVTFFLALVWSVEDRPLEERWEGAMPLVLGVAAGLLLLIKVSVGVLAIGMLAIGVWRLSARPLRAALTATAAMLGAIALGWLATGNSLTAFPRWLTGTQEIASGFITAMDYEQPGREWEYAAVFVLIAGLAVLMLAIVRFRPRAEQLVLLGITAVMVFGAFRQGFVRHDFHSLIAFSALVAVPLAFRIRTRELRIATLAFAAVAALVFLRAAAEPNGPGPVDVLNPWPRLERFADQAATLVIPSRRRNAMADAEERIADHLRIPARMLDRVRGRSVHIEPVEISAAWAHDLDWRPTPVFQRYSAYTPYLDRRNAEFLLADEGPEVVLRQNYGSKTLQNANPRTNPLFESPRYSLALICGYREVAAVRDWFLLERSAYRCGEPRELATVTGVPGTAVAVPPAGPDEALLLSIEAEPPRAAGLRRLLFKPRRQTGLGFDLGRTFFRLSPRQLDGPLVIHLPETVGWREFRGSIPPPDVTVANTTSPVTFRFRAVRVSARPIGGADPEVVS